MNLSLVTGNPVSIALVSQLVETRPEKRAYREPLEELQDESTTIVGLALHNILTENSYLPENMVNDLTIASNYIYKIETYRGNNEFNTTVVVNPIYNGFDIYIVDHEANKLISKSFLITHQNRTNVFIDSELTKAQYLETAGRLSYTNVLQYNEDLSFSYKVLFHLVFFIELNETGNIEEVLNILRASLYSSELTLQLNITNTVMLYGDVDSDGTLHLYIRQIGTPDTYWKRTASLAQLLGQ